MHRTAILHRRAVLKASLVAALALILAKKVGAQTMDDASQSLFDTVTAFMGAMGGGDMETISSLMADDMVWHNEGDASLPWVGRQGGDLRIPGPVLTEFSNHVVGKH